MRRSSSRSRRSRRSRPPPRRVRRRRRRSSGRRGGGTSACPRSRRSASGSRRPRDRASTERQRGALILRAAESATSSLRGYAVSPTATSQRAGVAAFSHCIIHILKNHALRTTHAHAHVKYATPLSQGGSAVTAATSASRSYSLTLAGALASAPDGATAIGFAHSPE